MTTEVQELAIKLAQFESTHENHKGLSDCLTFCQDYFKDNDLYIERINNQGVKCLLLQNKKTLTPDVLLLGHIDTVPGKPELFEGKVIDGWLYGRGTLDMKAFVATSMVVFKEAIKNTNKLISLLIVTDEELGGEFGAMYMTEQYGLAPKIVLVPDDGEEISSLVKENKEITQLKFTATGVESHACRPWDGKNAIEMLYKTFNNLAAHFNECRTVKSFTWVDTINLGIISGGSATNEVPGDATMNVDIRLTHNSSLRPLDKILDVACEDGVTYEVINSCSAVFLDESNEVVKNYCESITKVTGKQPNYIQSGGATDGVRFAKKGSLVITHQGTGKDCQSDKERVLLESLDQLVEIQLNFIANL